MKRALYFASLLCLFGMLFCLSRWYALPKNVAQTVEDVQNDDPSARSEVQDLLMPDDRGDILLRDAGGFLIGFGVLFFVGRRIR
jgi:hypothetical protein